MINAITDLWSVTIVGVDDADSFYQDNANYMGEYEEGKIEPCGREGRLDR